MVPYPYGTGFNCLRCHALVEPTPWCSRPGLADWVVRDRVRNPGGYFGLPLTQLTDTACALVSLLLLLQGWRGKARVRSVKLIQQFLDPAVHAAGRFISLHPGALLRRVCFLRDELRSRWFCLKKNA